MYESCGLSAADAVQRCVLVRLGFQCYGNCWTTFEEDMTGPHQKNSNQDLINVGLPALRSPAVAHV